jgi:hypothetical protein
MSLKHLLLLVFLVGFCCCKKEGVTVLQEPVVHYSFNGDANDLGPFGLDGVLRGDISLDTDSFGNPNSSYFFDNQTAFIEISDHPYLDITEQITISVWIYPKETAYGYIVQKGSDRLEDRSAGNGGPFSLDIFNGYPRSVFHPADNLTSYVVEGESPIMLNEWQHLAVTWDGDTAKIFYNGTIDGVLPFCDKLMASTGNMSIGTYIWMYPSHYSNFWGKIDNVRVYNRALSESEVFELFDEVK